MDLPGRHIATWNFSPKEGIMATAGKVWRRFNRPGPFGEDREYSLSLQDGRGCENVNEPGHGADDGPTLCIDEILDDDDKETIPAYWFLCRQCAEKFGVPPELIKEVLEEE